MNICIYYIVYSQCLNLNCTQLPVNFDTPFPMVPRNAKKYEKKDTTPAPKSAAEPKAKSKAKTPDAAEAEASQPGSSESRPATRKRPGAKVAARRKRARK